MAQYHTVITGRVVDLKRPDGMPREIHQVFLDDVENPNQLKELIMARTNLIVGMGGMLVALDPFHTTVRKGIDTNRIWVPMHMIAYLKARVIELAEEVPTMDEDGRLVLKSGKEVQLQ